MYSWAHVRERIEKIGYKLTRFVFFSYAVILIVDILILFVYGKTIMYNVFACGIIP